MSRVKLLPSILSANHGRLIAEAQTVDVPEIDYLHVDIMDGNFVPNITFGPTVVEALKQETRFKLDVHLMIQPVDEFVPLFAEAGADMITIHQEACVHLHRSLQKIREQGVGVGVTLNPATPLEMIEWVLEEVDLVLVMSVNPGFGGQEFIPASVERIRRLARMRQERNLSFIIEVDGGISAETAPRVVEAGADWLVAGYAVFGQKDRLKAIREILTAAHAAEVRQSSRLT